MHLKGIGTQIITASYLASVMIMATCILVVKTLGLVLILYQAKTLVAAAGSSHDSSSGASSGSGSNTRGSSSHSSSDSNGCERGASGGQGGERGASSDSHGSVDGSGHGGKDH